MTIPNHPLIASVKPLLKATGAELVALDALIAGDIPLVWEGVTIAGVRLPALHGALDRIMPMPTALVTHCTFGGPDLTTLYVTTGSRDRDPTIDPMAGHLFMLETGIRGLPARIFAL